MEQRKSRLGPVAFTLGSVVMLAAQIPPKQAISNTAAWLEAFGVDRIHIPQFLQSPGIDSALTVFGIAMMIFGAIWWWWRRRKATAPPDAPVGVTIGEMIGGTGGYRQMMLDDADKRRLDRIASEDRARQTGVATGFDLAMRQQAYRERLADQEAKDAVDAEFMRERLHARGQTAAIHTVEELAQMWHREHEER